MSGDCTPSNAVHKPSTDDISSPTSSGGVISADAAPAAVCVRGDGIMRSTFVRLVEA